MLTLDLREFERAAERMGGAADQIAFALSGALNDAVKIARRTLIDQTWPKHVEVRNRNFLRNALLSEFATKTNLRVAITNTGTAGNRAHLKLHMTGGTKQARGRLAIPSKRVVRTGKGVRQSQRPANLKRAVVKGNRIFQAEGKGKNSKLRLMYVLASAARQPRDVPFDSDFARVMLDEARRTFPARMAAAMRTRR